MELFLGIYACIATGMFFGTIKDFNNVAVTPNEIYECNDFNMLACVLLFLIMLFLNPLFYLAQFLYWLFHVGKEGKN